MIALPCATGRGPWENHTLFALLGLSRCVDTKNYQNYVIDSREVDKVYTGSDVNLVLFGVSLYWISSDGVDGCRSHTRSFKFCARLWRVESQRVVDLLGGEPSTSLLLLCREFVHRGGRRTVLFHVPC